MGLSTSALLDDKKSSARDEAVTPDAESQIGSGALKTEAKRDM